QMQTGDYADSFRAFDISTQLYGYLNGTPRQILAMTSPSWLAVRTRELTNGFYVFSYLDSADQSQRLLDSWSKWTFNSALGQLVGITTNDGDIYSVTLRKGIDGTYLVLDRFIRDAGKSDYPHLDSMRPWNDGGNTGTIRPGWATEAQASIAYNRLAGDKFLLGQPLADYQKLFDASVGTSHAYAMMGSNYESSMEPTAPYMRDQKDKAILDGRLTLTA
ncbi:hypothetical protein MTQ87_12650, partial [Staphylococcus hyicus]|uniref:phage nozzle protein n=1 Tax=Staphylococcus hyicus TaxID=1284 RepID=UPI00208E23EF